MKKLTVFAVLFFLFSFSLAACAPGGSGPALQSTPAASGPIRVVAVETFLADIVQNVAGDRLTVQALIPAGLDPHSFEPAPQDVARIAEADVLVINGAGFESWLAPTLENAGGQRLVIDASAGLTSREGREGEEAVLSAEERADAFCANLGSADPQAEQITAADAAAASALPAVPVLAGPTPLFYRLALHYGANDRFGGFLRLSVDRGGEAVLAFGAGDLSLYRADGSQVEVEEALALPCAGLTRGQVFDLEPGEYLVEFSSFTDIQTPFVVSPAGVHHHDGGDPHFWLDPLLVIHYVENIRDGLTSADPDGKAVYAANAAAYIERLKQLDAEIQAMVAQIPAEKRLLVTNHESFGYFADRYGFRVIGTVIPSVSTGSAPSAQQLARLVDRVRQTGASAVFLETGANPQLAQQLAAETGVKVVEGLFTHSITGPEGPAPTYIEMMRYNTALIVDALK